MRFPLHIQTHDRRLGYELRGAVAAGKSVVALNVPDGVSLAYEGNLVRKAYGFPEVLQFIVDVSVNVEVSLFGAWLYDKVKNREVERIVINRRVITEITEQGIRRVLEEEIRSLR